MHRKRWLRHGFWAAALCAVLVLSAQSSSADDDLYPGLPLPGDGGLGYSVIAQGGISYAKRAKQWFRTPDGMVNAAVALGADPADPTGNRKFTAAESYFVSPAGAPEHYGYLAPMTVRSVGFGLIPVEATVQISQRRENGYPVPLKTKLDANYVSDGGIPQTFLSVNASDTVVDDAVNVQILGVRVDGVDLELTGDCRTAEPAPLHLVGKGYTIPYPDATPTTQDDWFRSHDPSEYYNPLKGGDLTGTITIPSFTGCTTASGDDLSALMTLAVSGPDNPVSARNGWPCVIKKDGYNWPAPPGMATPKEAGCYGTKTIPYPERPTG
jgi:hypothetical protein